MKPNEIAFIGVATEYCHTVQQTSQFQRSDFVDKMLTLLPRLYIMARDMSKDEFNEGGYLNSVLDETEYEAVRDEMANLLDPDDVYLETFEEDMKYSDTPVSASISESLADLYQELFNFVETIRDATDETVEEALCAVADDFRNYWSQTLVNVLRPLNSISVNATDEEF